MRNVWKLQKHTDKDLVSGKNSNIMKYYGYQESKNPDELGPFSWNGDPV